MKNIGLFRSFILMLVLALPFSVSAETMININTATAEQIAQGLSGVGPAKAKAIVKYRNDNGEFKSPDDLVMVKGIGASTVAKNRSSIRVDEQAE